MSAEFFYDIQVIEFYFWLLEQDRQVASGCFWVLKMPSCYKTAFETYFFSTCASRMNFFASFIGIANPIPILEILLSGL